MNPRGFALAAAAGLLAAHALLVVGAIHRQSPVWDEIVYPAAGDDLWHTGRVRFSADHPPLGKLLLAVPLVASSTPVQPPTPPGESFRLGFNFTYHNTAPALWLTEAPRFVNLALSLLLGVLLFVEARRRWGDASAVWALAAYALHPAILAHASLALLDLPLTFWMALALALAGRWRETDRPLWGALAVVAWTAALLTKVTALALAPVWVVWALIDRPRRTPLIGGLILGLIAWDLALRALHGGGAWALLAGRPTDLAVSRFPVYYLGRVWDRVPWGSGLVAWLMKMPLSFLAALGLALQALRRAGPVRDPWVASAGGVAGVAFLLMISVRSIIATGHYLFVIPCLAWCIAAGYRAAPAAWRPAFWALLAGLALETASAASDPLAFFNLAAGGTAHGWQRLADSDQDWGQGLPSVAAWMRRRGLDRILLAYSGAGDPRAYGIRYADVFSPALVTAEYRGEWFDAWPQGMYLALGTKVAQSEPEAFGWLVEHRRPAARLGGSVWIFDLTHDAEALRWLGGIYRATRRPERAAALERLAGGQSIISSPAR